VSFDAPEGRADDPGAPTTLAVVVEGPRLAAGLVDENGSILVRDRIATPTRDAWSGLESMIRRVLAAAPEGTSAPSAVATVCSGPVDSRAGSVSPHGVYGWSNFPIRERLEELTDLPVAVDSLAGAMAELRLRGPGPSTTDQDTSSLLESFLEVALGTSVDSAAVVNGRRLRGAHGNAGSIAHVNVEPGGKACWCGAEGCAEAYLSTTAIESEINRPLQRATPSIIERTGIMLGRAMSTVAVTVDVSIAHVSGALLDTLGEPMLNAARSEIEVRSKLSNVVGLQLVPDGEVALLVAAVIAARHAPDLSSVTDR
jgi:glucokinase